MNYASTRGGQSGIDAAAAIVKGIAADGGLFVPETLPYLQAADWQRLLSADYRQQAAYILEKFLPDFSPAEINSCVQAAYRPENFDHPAIAPLVPVGEKANILELWHGPTAAFKDMALQILPHLLQTSAGKIGEDQEIVILVATSGDTGKAALEGFKDVAGTRIVVFFPSEGVSAVQKQQMVTQTGNNVWVAGIRGNFDDAQTAVKQIFADPGIAAQLKRQGQLLSSANSINWGRLVPQVVYYIAACAEMIKQNRLAEGETVNVVVPTGNFGNILAAYYAREMGAPIHKLICASNDNHILTDFIRTGTYDRNRAFYKTLSPSMDILVSSNLERLLYALTGQDHQLVSGWMRELQQSGVYHVDLATKEKLQELFWAGFASDAETVATIRQVWAENHYLLDTHTAVAYHVWQEYIRAAGDDRQTILVSTASPFKFTASVSRAVMENTQAGDEFALVRQLSDYTGLPIPAGLRDLEQKPVLYQTILDKTELAPGLLNYLKK
jgi:threonine synthase